MMLFDGFSARRCFGNLSAIVAGACGTVDASDVGAATAAATVVVFVVVVAAVAVAVAVTVAVADAVAEAVADAVFFVVTLLGGLRTTQPPEGHHPLPFSCAYCLCSFSMEKM